MKLGGSGRQMATTRQSQHITSSSLVLTVLLTQSRSGEQKQKGSTVFFLAFGAKQVADGG